MKYNFYIITKTLKSLAKIVQGFMQVVDYRLGTRGESMLSDITNSMINKVNKDLDMILEDWEKRKTAICIELGKLETIERADRYKGEEAPEEIVLRIRGEAKWDLLLSNQGINSCDGCEECGLGVEEWK